jgi:hypothetical protein
MYYVTASTRAPKQPCTNTYAKSHTDQGQRLQAAVAQSLASAVASDPAELRLQGTDSRRLFSAAAHLLTNY